MPLSVRLQKPVLLLVALAAGALSQPFAPASAQSAPSDRPRVFETPLGLDSRAAARRPIGPRRDNGFNRTRVQGGAGASAASVNAIGNSITVITRGSGNTVTVNADQINTGNQRAVVVLNGRLDLN